MDWNAKTCQRKRTAEYNCTWLAINKDEEEERREVETAVEYLPTDPASAGPPVRINDWRATREHATRCLAKLENKVNFAALRLSSLRKVNEREIRR